MRLTQYGATVLVTAAIAGSACQPPGPEYSWCSDQTSYSSNWGDYDFALESKEPDGCPEDLEAEDILDGGGTIVDYGDRDGNLTTLEIENSDGEEVADAANGFFETLPPNSKWVSVVYTEYPVATGALCWDKMYFTVFISPAGVAWAETTVYYQGTDVLICA